MNRIALFSFYDEEGIVDDYIIYLLNDIKKYCTEIHCAVNGFLSENSETKLKIVCTSLIKRENKGFDAWGYKTLIERLGYKKLEQFDEVLCFNHTCFGPIGSFEQMFSKMEKDVCDFWGLYLVNIPKREIYNQGIHIPSYFVVYRNSLIKSAAFREFWNDLPVLNNYNEAVKLFEQSQTPFFESKGFKVGAAFDFSILQGFSEYWFLAYQAEMLIYGNLPLLKRRPFFKIKNKIDEKFYKKVIDYLKEKTDYNIDLIWENLERTQKISEIKSKNSLKTFWWKFLSKTSYKKKQKYIDKLKYQISRQELKKLFMKEKYL